MSDGLRQLSISSVYEVVSEPMTDADDAADDADDDEDDADDVGGSTRLTDGSLLWARAVEAHSPDNTTHRPKILASVVSDTQRGRRMGRLDRGSLADRVNRCIIACTYCGAGRGAGAFWFV